LAEVKIRDPLGVPGKPSIVVEATDDSTVGERRPDQAGAVLAEESIPACVMKPGSTNTPRIRIAVPVSTTIVGSKPARGRGSPP